MRPYSYRNFVFGDSLVCLLYIIRNVLQRITVLALAFFFLDSSPSNNNTSGDILDYIYPTDSLCTGSGTGDRLPECSVLYLVNGVLMLHIQTVLTSLTYNYIFSYLPYTLKFVVKATNFIVSGSYTEVDAQ